MGDIIHMRNNSSQKLMLEKFFKFNFEKIKIGCIGSIKVF